MLDKAIEELRKADTVSIKGRAYTTVATRVEIFRKYFPPPEWAIVTHIHSIEDAFVRVTSEIRHNGVVCATGIAEENRSQGPINRTSAMENAETSAIGRALASFGLHGGEFASAGEVENAIAGQKESEQTFVKTNLKATSHDLVSDFHSCTDMDMLIALWNDKTTKDFCKAAKSHYPEGLEAVVEAKDTMKERIAIQEGNTVLGAG